MKKFLAFFLVLFGCIMIPNVFAEEKSPINVHMFKSSTCPHCAEAMTFFEALSKDPEYSQYFHFISYETNGSTPEIQKNVALAEKVEAYFGEEFEGVPLIVIGDQKFDGYVSTIDEQLKERIKLCYENQCEDIEPLKKGHFEILIPVIIAVVAIGGISYLILLCCKPVNVATNALGDASEILESKENPKKHVEEKNQKEQTNKKKVDPSKKKEGTSKKKAQ